MSRFHRITFCCYQSVKDKNFESNSQQVISKFIRESCCYQSVKDKNFESNSQHGSDALFWGLCCYQSVKDKNFESNSQQQDHQSLFDHVVISLSKIKISKAIHNKIVVWDLQFELLSVCQR